MGMNVEKEVAALKAMTVPELRARYAEVFGEECRSHHKALLWKRIIWRMQANEEGGLSDRARRRAEELANDADLRIHAPKGAGGCGRARPPRQPLSNPAACRAWHASWPWPSTSTA